jgi:hypothetical protein
MKRKARGWWLPEAIRLDGEGRSCREIAEILKRAAKPGQKPPSKTTIFAKVREANGVVPTPAPVAPPPPPAPPPEPVPLDETPMDPEDLVGLLTGLLRAQSALAQRLAAEQDHQGAQRATRTAASIAVQLGKQQALRAGDASEVRVKATDMAKAAERAAEGLSRLAERVVAERATWPACPTCGLPSGHYPPAEKSPLRAMVERVFGRGL